MPGFSLAAICSKAARNGVTAIVPTESLPGFATVNTNFLRTAPSPGEDAYLALVQFVGAASVAGIATLESPLFDSVTKNFEMFTDADTGDWGKAWFEPGETSQVNMGRNQVDFRAAISNGNTAGETEACFLGLSYGGPAVPYYNAMPNPANILCVDGTGEDAVTSIAQWDLNAVTFTGTALKPGTKYVALGAHVRSANALGWRFVPSGGAQYRPGCVGTTRNADHQYDKRNIYIPANGRFEFDGATPPQIEVLCGDADTPTIQLLCVESGKMG